MKRILLSWESIPETVEDYEVVCSDEEFELLKNLAGKYINSTETSNEDVELLINLREKLQSLKPLNSSCINLKAYDFEYLIRCGELL